MEGGRAAGTVRHLCVTMDGYTRRGKAGLKKGDEGSWQDDSDMCNVRCVGVCVLV
jgi:hypothetical protein